MKDIIQQAKDLSICQEWHEKMQKNPTMEYFCDMYFKGDDWAMEKDYPTLELLEKYKGQTEEFGLYKDFEGELKNRERLALFGNSNATIEYDGFIVAKLNIRHNSKVKIIAREYAIVSVNVLDNAEVEVEKHDKARVLIYKK